MDTQIDSAGLTAEKLGAPGTLLFENDLVRVWELVLKPGEYCLWHDHPYDHLLIVYDGAKIEGVYANGETVILDIEDNQTYYVPRSDRAEAARNLSPDRTLRELIIDLKTPSAKPAALEIFNFFRPGAENTATTVPTF